MKLIFAVLDVSLTMGLTRCYKTEGFFTFIYRNVRLLRHYAIFKCILCALILQHSIKQPTEANVRRTF